MARQETLLLKDGWKDVVNKNVFNNQWFFKSTSLSASANACESGNDLQHTAFAYVYSMQKNTPVYKGMQK